MTKIDEEALHKARDAHSWARSQFGADPLEAGIAAYLTALEAKGYVIEQGWQPIETAPRDGTRVLLAVKPADTVDNWYGRTPPDVDGFGLFKHLDNGWSTPGSGGWADFFFSGWRPLPEPPLAARGE